MKPLKKCTITFVLDKELYDKIKEYGTDQSKPISAICRLAIRQFLKNKER